MNSKRHKSEKYAVQRVMTYSHTLRTILGVFRRIQSSYLIFSHLSINIVNVKDIYLPMYLKIQWFFFDDLFISTNFKIFHEIQLFFNDIEIQSLFITVNDF